MTEPLQPGQRLGAYRIIRPLGGGGMGQVYEAEHVSLGVRRALKVFTTESHHIDFLRKRFIAEGRILADLDHPRIVHVYDLVVDDETGTPYFAMDLVLSPDGTPRTLENEREAGVSEEKVAMWFKDICEGLAYIHSHKVVHRDISLDNILIGPDGHAVISDFGIAKIVDDNYRRKINVTVTMASKDAKDLCMGKGNYMAPELKQGGRETPASDAYALGVLLFRLLTGFWYEPNRLEKTKALLSGFENDWFTVISKLCAVNQQFRVTDDECLSLANAVKCGGGDSVRTSPKVVALMFGVCAFAAVLCVGFVAFCTYSCSAPKPSHSKDSVVKVRTVATNNLVRTTLENAEMKRESNGQSLVERYYSIPKAFSDKDPNWDK